MADPLFTIPIPAVPNTTHTGGTITVTQPKPKVYLLTFLSPVDNRCTLPFCRALLQALDVLEFGGYETGVLVTTSGIPKFYSNGLDLEHAVATEGYWPTLYEVWKRFLTFPMPTVALMNGHAFAGGLMLATAHDYRLAPSPKGFLCVNELIFGAPLKPPMAALFRTKYSAATFRTMVLEAHRFDAKSALAAGIVDSIASDESQGGKLGDALRFIESRGLVEKGKSGVYGVLKTEMYKDLISMLASPGLDAEEARFEATQTSLGERQEFGRVWVEQWKKDQSKAKL